MPELSRFFGIIIRMFAEPGSPHHRPHFHAYYQSDVGIISIEPVELLAGSLPRKQLRLADFDPATLHDWPENEDAFRELAKRWKNVTA